MDSYPLTNLFKLRACCKPIANNEVINENAIGIHLLNEKHDCNVVSINSMNINCANEHNQGDNHDVSCDLENFELHDESIIYNDIYNTNKTGFERTSTLGNSDPTTLEDDQSYEFF